MKSNESGIAMPVSKSALNELLKETKETLALDIHHDGNKFSFKPIDMVSKKINGTVQHSSNNCFGAVDMWKVQKQKRTALDLRRRVN